MNKTHKKQIKFQVITIIVLLISLSILVGCSQAQTINPEGNITTNPTPSTVDKIAYLTKNKYSITNTDSPNDVNLKLYASCKYGKNAILSNSREKKITIRDNDDIIKIVPEELFKQVGTTQHVGMEYGFFIETRKPFADNDMLLSTVMLIDITTDNDMFEAELKSHLKIQIKPIFQADFAYVQKGNNKIYSLQKQNYDFFKEDYKKDLEVSYPNIGNAFIIPIPTATGSQSQVFKQHNKYYITNPSNQTSLYNVNYLNPSDEGYDMYNDPGSFFTLNNFTYDGIFLEKGKTSVNDVGSVICDSTMFVFDALDNAQALKGVFKTVPVLGQIITASEIANGIAEIAEQFKYHTVTEEKKIEYEASYNSRELQLINGGLHKDAAIAIRSNTGKQLLFGTDDNFTFYYQVNCDNISIDTNYATLVNLEFMSVVSDSSFKTSFGELLNFTSSFSDSLKNHYDENYREIPDLIMDDTNANKAITILPYYESINKFKPKYTGTYSMDITHKYASFDVYEAVIRNNGSIDLENSIKLSTSSYSSGIAICDSIELSKDKTYFIRANLLRNESVDKISGRYGIVNLNIEFLPMIIEKGETIRKLIMPNDTLIILLNSASIDAFNYNISSNEDIQLEVSYGSIMNNYYVRNGKNIYGSLITENKKYYIKVENTGNIEQNVTITIDKVQQLKTDEETPIDVLFEKVYEVSLPFTMHVNMAFNSAYPMYVEIYDSNNNLIEWSPVGATNKTYSFTIRSNQKYYIMVKHSTQTSLDALLSFEFNINKLKPIYNMYNRLYKDEIFLYENNDYSGDFDITANFDFIIFDDIYNVLNPNQDGNYTLIVNRKYFVYVLENAVDCHIDFNIVYTTETSGIFSDNGVAFIKFIPSKSGEYRIEGISTYSWYSENMTIRYGELNANEVYYLMVEGVPLEAYNINISYIVVERTQIAIGMAVERNAGQFYFVVTQEGTYTFKTFRNSDISRSNITVYNQVGEEYCKDICVDFNMLEIFLTAGTYYLDLEIEPVQETVSLRISKKR